MAALGEPLPREARGGLVLFLRRGMWAWAQALSVGRRFQPPTHSLSSSPTASNHRRAVIDIFAAMALNSNSGSAP